ncbi:MAG: hypothetical protein RIC56_12080 [Pseudomonadales bacterium]
MTRAPGSSRQRRLVRTIVLGSLAVVASIAWLSGQLGMDRAELLDFALTSVLLVAGLVVLAVFGAVALRLLKRLLGR